MISVEEAKKLILENAQLLPAIVQSVSESLNFVLAEDILSPIYYPPFDQSAMDGYAFRFSDYRKKNELKLIGEAPAGQPFIGTMYEGTTIRVFTGGMIPHDADTVVMQEHISNVNSVVRIQNDDIFEGANIRAKGSLLRQGDVVMTAGMIVNAGAVGFLHSLGITQVKVFSQPKVSILITGDELVKPGFELSDGKVFESNSSMLSSAINSIGIQVRELLSTEDNKEQILKSLTHLLSYSDIVFISGGVSVGDYDFVAESLTSIEVERLFHKVSQKPGKPLYFGKKISCLIFGLPGNPASALTCFYEYGLPAIKQMQGQENVFLKIFQFPLAQAFSKKPGLSLFLKAKMRENCVAIADKQASNDIGGFAYADCLVYLPASKGDIKAGELVEVHILP